MEILQDESSCEGIISGRCAELQLTLIPNNFAEILESVLYSRIYLMVKQLVSPEQPGKTRSTETNLAYFTQIRT